MIYEHLDAMTFTDDHNASASTLPFILDDLGCNGSESNLLECLPKHNCALSINENAGVRCLRKGN